MNWWLLLISAGVPRFVEGRTLGNGGMGRCTPARTRTFGRLFLCTQQARRHQTDAASAALLWLPHPTHPPLVVAGGLHDRHARVLPHALLGHDVPRAQRARRWRHGGIASGHRTQHPHRHLQVVLRACARSRLQRRCRG